MWFVGSLVESWCEGQADRMFVVNVNCIPCVDSQSIWDNVIWCVSICVCVEGDGGKSE